MKRHLTNSFFLLLTLLAFACEKGPEKPEPKVYLPDEFVINTLTFDDGTWWAFEDSATGKKDTLKISDISYFTVKNPNGQKGELIIDNYLAKLTQTSTGRIMVLTYNIRHDYNWKNRHTPLVELVNAYNFFGYGTENLLFNTEINDTLPGGSAKINGQWVSSKFILVDKGEAISVNSKYYSFPFLDIHIKNSTIYNLKDLNILLIKNVGIAKHNLDGNFSLVDFHLNPIRF